MPFPGINNEDHRLSFRPRILDLVFESHNQKYSSPMISSPLAKTTTASPQTLETHEEHVLHSTFCNQYSSPSLPTSSRSHHDFLHRYQFHETVQKIPLTQRFFFWLHKSQLPTKIFWSANENLWRRTRTVHKNSLYENQYGKKKKLCLAAGWTNAF
jgi:hypothetical protein